MVVDINGCILYVLPIEAYAIVQTNGMMPAYMCVRTSQRKRGDTPSSTMITNDW